MKHGGEIASALVEAKKEVSTNKSNPLELSRAYNKIAAKFKAVTTPRTGMLTDIETEILKFNSFYMLTSSLGYMFQNLTQPMMGLAIISGDIGFGKTAQTMKALMQGYGIAREVVNTSFLNQVGNVASLGLLGKNSSVKLDLDKAPNDVRALLEQLELYGLLDGGLVEDLRFDAVGEGGVLGPYREMTHRLYQSARYVEAVNRISTAVAALRMAKRNPKALRKYKMTAQEFAVRAVQDSQGNFSRLDTPSAMDIPGARIPLQFRAYQFQMAWLYVDAAKQAFKGASPEIRHAGMRKLGLMMGVVSVMAGLTGVPAAGLLNIVAQALLGGGDDEEGDLDPSRDFERWIREYVDDERVATLLARGVPAALGWDFSQKTSQANIFMPYDPRFVGVDLRDGGYMGFVAQLLFGPTGTMVNNATNVHDFVERGDLYRAAEYMLPRGLRSYLETFRYASDGYTQRNGLVVVDPADFDIADLALNLTGMPSTAVNQIKWSAGQRYEIEQHFSSETTRIRRGYLAAVDDGDRDAQRQYREEFMELQNAKDRVRPFFNNSSRVLRRQSLSDLLRAPRDRDRDQRRLDEITDR